LSGAMADELSVLVELQHKDAELGKLMAGRREIPAAMKARDEELAMEKAKLREKEAELEEVSKRRRSQESEIEELTAKIKKLEGRLLKVATNKEYEAMLAEIGSGKERRSKAEGDLLKLMEQEEDLSKDVRDSRLALEPLMREIEEKKSTLRKELEHNENLIPALEKHRTEIAERLSSAMRARYERISKGKNGVAVVPVRKGACGGCFTALPAQRINEIKLSDRLVTCEHCGRILVWNESPTGEADPV